MSRILCECREITRETVQAAIDDGATLKDLKRLGCTVQCGSCLPEVEDMLGKRRAWWADIHRPAALAAAMGLAVLFAPPLEDLLASGPENTGHDGLECADCHLEAPGTTRQQLQANTQWLLGSRETPADFVHGPVDNDACEDCHDRDGEDRHPPFRFREARFEDARDAIAPQYCVSCHQEHQGGRVTNGGETCEHCHEEFEEEVLEPDHQALADDGRFETCLQCHDFHDNHLFDEPTSLDDAIPLDEVQAYLDGGEDPYSTKKRFGDGR
ncbi:MAG: (2Fe-2S)-binding protein [Proteobacteria bacterium]|nr:(2Fe-2S)-binding protein [Pseudomonadota bacterium]